MRLKRRHARSRGVLRSEPDRATPPMDLQEEDEEEEAENGLEAAEGRFGSLARGSAGTSAASFRRRALMKKQSSSR